MDETPNFCASAGLSSTLTFPTVDLPWKSCASSSMVGPRALHGPHHGAQKSTSVGVEALTSSSKFDSVISTALVWVVLLMLFPFMCGQLEG